jgi:hypothetical protein
MKTTRCFTTGKFITRATAAQVAHAAEARIVAMLAAETPAQTAARIAALRRENRP